MDIFATSLEDPRPHRGRMAATQELWNRLRQDIQSRSHARLLEFSDVEGFVTSIRSSVESRGIDLLLVHAASQGARLSRAPGPDAIESRPNSTEPDPSDDWPLLSLEFGRCRVNLRTFDELRSHFAELAPLMNPGAQAVFLGAPVGRDPILLYRFAMTWGIPCIGSVTTPWGAEALDIGSIGDGPWMTATPDARFRLRERCPPLDPDRIGQSAAGDPGDEVVRGRVS